jgi:hypothetical protein
MKKSILIGFALSILAGCASNTQQVYTPANTLPKQQCPKIFIGSELDNPTGHYNLTYLASTSTKSFQSRLEDLQLAIIYVEEVHPDKVQLDKQIRESILNTSTPDLTAKKILADLLTVSYYKENEAKGLNNLQHCDYSKQDATVNYLKDVFDENQTLIFDALLTQQDYRKTDI